jgi:hypothetical protein
MKHFIVISTAISLISWVSLADPTVTGTQRFTHPPLGMTVISGQLELPAGGVWTVMEPGKDSGLAQVQLARPADEREARQGSRVHRAEIQRQTEQERWPLWSLYRACADYAVSNKNVGPNSWEELRSRSRHHYIEILDQMTTNFFLIPGVPIPINGGTGTPARSPLALQLRPLVADGKHWVLYNNGQSDRVRIDTALCSLHGLTVQPQQTASTETPKPPPGTANYAISALLAPGAATSPVRLSLLNAGTGARLDCTWDTGAATEGAQTVLSDWARARAISWFMLAGTHDAPILRYWLTRCEKLYGTHMPDYSPRQDRAGESVDAFGVLGGRAAVRETLQMQALTPSTTGTGSNSLAIATIPGVEVKSHPFDEMLQGVTPGTLPLADAVPADRAFVYFPKPEALLPLLEGGADFVFQGGTLAAANPAAYDLKKRYVERLAITDKWMRELLIKSGAVKEIAVLFPDLFFIDGTDITIIARIPSARLLKPALGMLGVAISESIQERSSPAGKTFWVMAGDLLVISTSRSEAEQILALRKAGGAGSLGQSAEFRYMLSQTPVREQTRVYCYLSDAFIRRLVGPEVKIGQLRRLIAKGEMENVTAAALLYRLDGHTGRPDVATLVSKGYLAAQPETARGCTLDDQLVASCPQYGSPARLKTFLENPIIMVTPAEATSYKAYLDNYSRFWRRFFDPMAFRLDDGPDGELQLTTFILPLIDNTLYNGLKEVMRHKEDGTPLRLPDLTPKPLALLSANLSEEAWTKVTREMFSALLKRYTSLDPAAFDKIGPGIHLAIHDADPILTFGAGDVMGIFGSQTLGRGGSEMLFIPALASILTRPCQLIVELQEPDVVRRMMLAASAVPVGERSFRRDPAVSFYKLEGRDAWICAISIEGLINIRFGVEILNDYLVLSNLPWSQKPVFGPTRTAELNTMALALHPESGILQMPGLFTAACEQERAAAFQGARYLYPLMACGAGSPAAAAEQSRILFGFVPEHPGTGQWVWENGQLRSTVYGNPHHPVQPEYKAGTQAFGVLAGLDMLNLNLQFEDAGLRVLTRWKMK